MVIGITLLVVGILAAVIWIVIEVKRFRHKLLAIFLVALILFTYISFISVIRGKDIDFKTADGLKIAGKLYLSWLGSVFSNLKTLTINAINMDWKANETISGD